jgi:hypothetical protein
MGSSPSVFSPLRQQETPTYYTNEPFSTSDRSRCLATWALIAASEPFNLLGLFQHHLDLKLIEYLPDMYMHTSGVVTLMLTHIICPQIFHFNERNRGDVDYIVARGTFLSSMGVGKQDLIHFGSSMFYALKAVCGEFYDEEVDRSWKRLYSFLLRNLIIRSVEEEGSLFKDALTTFLTLSSPISNCAPISIEEQEPASRGESGVQRFYTRRENCILLDDP